jgi:hypothetical protein
MISKRITMPALAFATAASALLGAIPVSAVTVPAVTTAATVNADANMSATAAGTSVKASGSVAAQIKANAGAKLVDVKARGDSDIAARIDSLNKLNDRVQAMKDDSAGAKAAIAAAVQTNISGLSTLKTKIDADTDVTAARTDDQSIFNDYRIYALVIPQGWLLASGDRVSTINGLMMDIGVKLQARISADQAAGKDVTALIATQSDMNAKIADSQKQVAAAQARISVLTPDQGDTTKAAANKAALVAARADIKVATQDLSSARADIAKVMKGLKSMDASMSATTTTTVTH